MKGFISQYNQEKNRNTFRVAKVEDAPALAKFTEHIFEPSGGHGTPEDVLIKWFTYPYLEVGHLLLLDEKIVGYFTILPLHHQQIMEIMHKETRPRHIPIEKFAPLEPDKPINFFIADVAAEPTIKQLAVHLLAKMLGYFQELGKQGVEIEGIYATASTREGINICRHAGMKQMDVPGIQPNWIPFEMKVQETKNKLIEDYLKA